MELKELMAEFGKRCGVDFPVPDGEDMVTARVDDMDVVFQSFPDLGKLIIYAEVCEEPPQETGRLAQAMLQANHLFQGTGGATLSQDADSKKYYLCRYEELTTLDAEKFFAAVEKFVNVLETWRKIVADYRPEEAASAPAFDSSTPFGDPDAGFLTV